MATRLQHSLLLLLGLAGAVSSPRRIPAQVALVARPDTLGANFDHASPGKATLQDYDFLVGSWKFKYQQRDSISGGYGPLSTGEWTGKKAYETLFQDEFVRVVGAPLVTYRVFNPTRGVWEIQGVGIRRGVWQPGVSWSDGKDRFVVQQNPDRNLTLRIRYYSITPEHFQWRADGSRDGGKTWMRDVILIEATRVR